MSASFSWNLTSVLASKFALLILNQRIISAKRVSDLWSRAQIRVLVDGGANRWHKISVDEKVKELPNLVCGDFDSIEPTVLKHYQGVAGVKVVETPDQDHTDFTKALMLITPELDKIDNVLAFIENSGRLDQIFANIETLFVAPQHIQTKPLFLISSQSISWILLPGTHTIDVADETDLKSHIGLIPVGEPATHVTTEGLKWNLNDQELAFGKLVSTSNTFAENAKKVVVKTDKPLLWTMDY